MGKRSRTTEEGKEALALIENGKDPFLPSRYKFHLFPNYFPEEVAAEAVVIAIDASGFTEIRQTFLILNQSILNLSRSQLI